MLQYVLECQLEESFVSSGRSWKASMDAGWNKKKQRRQKMKEVQQECTRRVCLDVWRPAPLRLVGMGDAAGAQERKCCIPRTESLGVVIYVSWLDGECCWWPGNAAPRQPSPGRVGPRVIGWCYLAAAAVLQFKRDCSTGSGSFCLNSLDSCSCEYLRCPSDMCRSSPAPLAGSGEPCRWGDGRARAEIQRRQNDAANAYGEAHERAGLHRTGWPGAAGVRWCVLLLVWVVGAAVCCVSLRVAACGRRAVRTANSWADQSNVGLVLCRMDLKNQSRYKSQIFRINYSWGCPSMLKILDGSDPFQSQDLLDFLFSVFLWSSLRGCVGMTSSPVHVHTCTCIVGGR